jgi:hypothetical protein
MSDLMQSIPIGHDNAQRASMIWRRYGIGAETSMSKKLNDMAQAGTIRRRQQQHRHAQGFTWLYWREA